MGNYISKLISSGDDVEETPPDLVQRRKPRTSNEAYHIAFLLRRKLDADIVPCILRYADICIRSTTRSEQPVSISERQAPHSYIVTKPIDSAVRLEHPVTKVVFKINSKDQGWVSDRNGGNWTWFTAVVFSPDDPEQHELAGEREIVRNELACDTSKMKVVEWRDDAEDEEERLWVQSLRNGDQISVRAWARFGGWSNNIRSAEVEVYTAALIA